MTPTAQNPAAPDPVVSALVSVRTDRRLTRAEIARRMGSSVATVQALEEGRNDPYLSTLRRYAGALGVDLQVAMST